MSDEKFLLTGTREPAVQPVVLRAGPLTADLIDGNLRTIRHGGTEVLRAIGYIVRDRDWGTYEPAISGLTVNQRADGFSVSYNARCEGPDSTNLMFAVAIVGQPDGNLSFDVTATPDGDFKTNRCGFCILHPIRDLAGAPVKVEHTDGTVIETTLPEKIDPWQPFKAMRAITTTVRPGLLAECRMEGDTFEMEDQRNWSDASYKTYVRPLALPWPYTLPSGEPVRQTVSLRFEETGEGVHASALAVRNEPISLSLGAAGPALPAIGLVIYPEDAQATIVNLGLLEKIAPQRLLFHFDRLAGHGAEAIRHFTAVASACPKAAATLEIAVPCRRALDAELGEIAAFMDEAGLDLSAVMVSPAVDRQSTPPGSAWPDCPALEDVYAAARRAFPRQKLGGGMLSYFTELNRKPVPAERLDFISHCTCPIVHAADDLSVMQSLEALPFITGSFRAAYGEKPYRIGPSTIAMRQNPYGGATKDNPSLQRIAMAGRDPRHTALFGAAWALGYAARVAPAGLDQLVLSSLAGPFGLVAGAGEPVAEGTERPLFHVVQALAQLSGAAYVPVETGQGNAVAGLGAATKNGVVVMLANLTPASITVDCSRLKDCPTGQANVLDAQSISSGNGFRKVAMRGGKLELGAYAVARLETLYA